MYNLVSSPLGLIHLISAIIALITSVIVISSTKGTGFHKKIGLIYVLSMLILNVTALFIYELSGGFNAFHFFALLSLFSIFGGMYFPLFKRNSKDWVINHLEVMSWSVLGLYAAFSAEISVRFFPSQYFWSVVFLSGGVITTLGAFLIRKRKRHELSTP